ncbi:MAG TPA: helix-turn-helix domain-containing protein [Wenzhouxiangella sp.]|nr:helix-turn-helix domain-containing protein [Wenzhouxiangella sp.]
MMIAHQPRNIPLHTPAELGAALREQRKSQGLTLEQLSGLSGLGMRFLSELERGKATAELGKTLEVARLLGLNCYLVPRSRSFVMEADIEHGDAG